MTKNQSAPGGLSFPKWKFTYDHRGWLIKRSTPLQSALVEAHEEAGVRGEIGETQISRFRKRMQRRKQTVLCHVETFPLEVTAAEELAGEAGAGSYLGSLAKGSEASKEIRLEASDQGIWRTAGILGGIMRGAPPFATGRKGPSTRNSPAVFPERWEFCFT